MPNSDYFIVLDLDSGTYFSLDRAVLIDTTKLTDAETDILNNGSDMQRSEMGDEIGEWLPNALGWESVEREEVVS